jgi:hypothetical protein
VAGTCEVGQPGGVVHLHLAAVLAQLARVPQEPGADSDGCCAWGLMASDEALVAVHAEPADSHLAKARFSPGQSTATAILVAAPEDLNNARTEGVVVNLRHMPTARLATRRLRDWLMVGDCTYA